MGVPSGCIVFGGDVVSKMQGKVKEGRGKTAYRAVGFKTQAPIECGDAAAEFTDEHKVLGIPVDVHMRLRPLLRQVEDRGHRGLEMCLATMEPAGMPICAILRALQTRILPKACHGAIFLLVRPDWATRLNMLQPFDQSMALSAAWKSAQLDATRAPHGHCHCV